MRWNYLKVVSPMVYNKITIGNRYTTKCCYTKANESAIQLIMQWASFDSLMMPVAMGDKDSFLAKYTECPDEPLGEGKIGSVVKEIRLSIGHCRESSENAPKAGLFSFHHQVKVKYKSVVCLKPYFLFCLFV